MLEEGAGGLHSLHVRCHWARRGPPAIGGNLRIELPTTDTAPGGNLAQAHPIASTSATEDRSPCSERYLRALSTLGNAYRR